MGSSPLRAPQNGPRMLPTLPTLPVAALEPCSHADRHRSLQTQDGAPRIKERTGGTSRNRSPHPFLCRSLMSLY